MAGFILAASQPHHRRFIVRDALGHPSNADILPVAALVRNGVDEPTVVSVSNEVGAGEYSIAFTAPAAVNPEDSWQLRVSYAVGGVSNHAWGKVSERLLVGSTVFRVFTVRNGFGAPTVADSIPAVQVVRNGIPTAIVPSVSPHTLVGDYLVSFGIPLTWNQDDEVELILDGAVGLVPARKVEVLGTIQPGVVTVVNQIVNSLKIRERQNKVQLKPLPYHVTLKPSPYKISLRC